MFNLLSRHRVRATFYHLTLVLTIVLAVAYQGEALTENTVIVSGWIIIFLDWLAEMYDPNPDNPGPWFKAHFHRIWDGKE